MNISLFYAGSKINVELSMFLTLGAILRFS
nr:MAG TPA: hypothetical protein [Caudoviricetes sp.]